MHVSLCMFCIALVCCMPLSPTWLKAFLLKIVNVFSPGYVVSLWTGAHDGIIIKCCFSVGSRLVLVCLLLTVHSRQPDSIFGIDLNVRQRLVCTVTSENAADNITFTRTTLSYFFICITWCIEAHILLSDDFHPKPGSESESFSITSGTQYTSLFTHNLSIIQLNIQSLVPKLDILETEM